jgi:hypothetical protein
MNIRDILKIKITNCTSQIQLNRVGYHDVHNYHITGIHYSVSFYPNPYWLRNIYSTENVSLWYGMVRP